MVPRGRDKAETAVLLEQAIPKNKRYSLRGCGKDYELMFTVLQKDLAPTRDVINSINLHLSKLKRITAEDEDSDRKFVLLVETIEKIARLRLSCDSDCTTVATTATTTVTTIVTTTTTTIVTTAVTTIVTTNIIH